LTSLQRFNVINEEDKDGKLNISTPRYETYGEYDKITGIYYLNAKGLKEIADELGNNKQLLLKELEKANVLIAKNITYYTKATRQRIKVYKIKFSEMVEPNTSEDEGEEALDIPF